MGHKCIDSAEVNHGKILMYTDKQYLHPFLLVCTAAETIIACLSAFRNSPCVPFTVVLSFLFDLFHPLDFISFIYKMHNCGDLTK